MIISWLPVFDRAKAIAWLGYRKGELVAVVSYWGGSFTDKNWRYAHCVSGAWETCGAYGTADLAKAAAHRDEPALVSMPKKGKRA